nr:hypothetical protein [uncultured Oscillibacter sp.]
MKNTLMFLLVALLLAFSLTACGGGGQTTGTADTYGSTEGSRTDGALNGSGDYQGDYDNDGYDDGRTPDARDALDDAGRSVRNAVDGAEDAIDRAF